MTREEAINDLKDFIDTYITVHGEEDTIAVSLDNVDVEAFHMAIEELERASRKCIWIKHDYRSICPQEHTDVCDGSLDKPYWRVPENMKEVLRYCPYCGKEIEVEE